ncbi:glycosyltransferase family 4 protein [candidate division KSB1 bacterium]|nr:glycosyltransferase family 4 protein [candidate division KSB1 bacterium]
MQLYYFSNERIPGRLACTVQQINMCECFANAGLEVRFINPYYFKTHKITKDGVYDYYSVKKNFKIITLPSLLSLSKSAIPQQKQKFSIPFIGGASLMASTWMYFGTLFFSGRLRKPTVIYSRNINAAIIFLRMKQKYPARFKNLSVFIEVHGFTQKPKKFLHALFNHADGLICITEAIKKELEEKHHIDPARILVAHDGVKSNRLKSQIERNVAREKIKQPVKSRMVLYTGDILPGKGVEIFIQAAQQFKRDTLFVLVGSTPEKIARLQESIPPGKGQNILFTGYVEPSLVPFYQSAADVLVLPNTRQGLYWKYTSPLKLFEYMASGRPIVATDLENFREVLKNRENALLVEPGDVNKMTGAISELLDNTKLAQKISKQALKDVEQYSWDNRAKNIISFIRSRRA